MQCYKLRFLCLFLLTLSLSVSVQCNNPIIKKDPPVDTSWDVAPSWSNTGDRLTFARPGIEDSVFTIALYLTDTLGGRPTLLSVGGLSSTWLPGDTELIFFKTDFKLYYLNLNTMSESLFCEFCGAVRYPEFSASTNLLYYEDRGVADGWARSIYSMDMSTYDTTRMTSGNNPRITQEGTEILFYRHDSVLIYNMTTDSTRYVTAGATAVTYDWAETKDWVYVSLRQAVQRFQLIYKMRRDGSNSSKVANGYDPKYSRTSNRVVFLRADSNNRNHLWLMDPNGGNEKQITF